MSFTRAVSRFASRVEADAELASYLRHYRGRSDVIVLGSAYDGVA